MNFQIVIDSLTRIVVDILNFIPNLINGLIILLVGVLVARLARWLLGNTLRRLGFDPLVERTGLTGSLRGLGVRTPISTLLAQLIFLLLLLSFLITSTRLMGLEAVAKLLENVLNLLPNAIAALLVFLIGGVAAQFMGNLVGALAAGGGLSYARRLGQMVQYIVSVFVVILALGVLGLDTALLVTAVTILIGAFGLALGLALGLGARRIVFHLLAGYYLRQRLRVGQPLTLGESRGTVSTIGSVSTTLSAGERQVIVPNGTLLETVVEAADARPAPPPPPAG